MKMMTMKQKKKKKMKIKMMNHLKKRRKKDMLHSMTMKNMKMIMLELI